MVIRIVQPRGHTGRLYVAGLRIHHGAFGLGVAVAGVILRDSQLGPLFIAGGVQLMWHDRYDFPWLFDNDGPMFR